MNMRLHIIDKSLLVCLILSVTSIPYSVSSIHAQSPERSALDQEKIASAISAGPVSITRDATIAEMDGQGEMHVLRQGTNAWVCMPGDPNSIANPPMCEDKPSQAWDYAFRHHLPKPSNTVPGITYMLAGAEQRSDSDPYDKTSPPIKIGPHWMIMWPFDPATTGLPTRHRPSGAYIMWAGTPYAHVHVMGKP
jgi:hypothetical protein